MPPGDHLLHGPTPGGAPLWMWLLFHVILLVLLGVDWTCTRSSLGEQTIARRANWLTSAWVLAAILFAFLVYHVLSRQYALEYLTGYGIEEALSVDNLFVFLVLFRSFGLGPLQQRRLLFLGVLGAILMRAAMIFAGIQLLQAFSWMNYVFGAILLYTAWHLLWKSQKSEPDRAPTWMNWLSRHLPVSSQQNSDGFVVRENGRRLFTPLFLALIAIETTDLVFATDSIPAVLAVSHHPFVVYTSNVFAVLGLRSLYFTLAAALERLHKLRYGLVAILTFVGAKMMLSKIVTISTEMSLAVVGAAVVGTVVWSLLSKPRIEKIEAKQNR